MYEYFSLPKLQNSVGSKISFNKITNIAFLSDNLVFCFAGMDDCLLGLKINDVKKKTSYDRYFNDSVCFETVGHLIHHKNCNNYPGSSFYI